MKRVFIIHGWNGNPDEGWFPWLKSELEKNGFNVFTPAMPEPARPRIDEWVNKIKEEVGDSSEETYFVGHSIGSQAILRYLETLNAWDKFGGVVLVAPWINLKTGAEDEDDKEIARPWLETPINWGRAKDRAGKFVAIFSENDPLVSLDDAKIFENKLGAKIILEGNKGHLGGSDGFKDLLSALEAILEMSKK